MPRIDFRDLVSNILVEQDPPPGASAESVNTARGGVYKILTDILKKHDELDFSNKKFNNNDTSLNDIFTVVAGKNYVADNDVKNNLGDVRVIDILQTLYDTTNNKTTYKTWEQFKELLNKDTNENYIKILNNYQNKINSLTLVNKEDWPILHVQVKRAYENALKEVASLGEKALQGDGELSNSSVIDAVQKIVNRRIGVFTRMAKLKSPKQPFTILINDIFKTPELYLTGSKKYSSDFAAVDKLYIEDLIKIAIAAKEFYADEVVKLKTQSPEQSPDDPQGRLPGFENTSLNLYDTFVNSVLVEMALKSQTQIGGEIASGARAPVQVMGTKYPGGSFSSQEYNRQFDNKLRQTGQEPESYRNQEIGQEPSKTINPSIIKQLEDKALQDVPNRIRFLTGIPVQYLVVDETGKDTQQKGVIDSSKEYNIGSILKINSPKSQNLINALGAIAQYSKTRPGAGEIASKTAGALGALRVGMGPVN